MTGYGVHHYLPHLFYLHFCNIEYGLYCKCGHICRCLVLSRHLSYAGKNPVAHRCNAYLSAFWYFLAFSEGLGLFDLLVIDLLWWRNTKRTRFSFLPEKKYYQNPKKHIESFWRGIPLFAAVAALSALIVTAL